MGDDVVQFEAIPCHFIGGDIGIDTSCRVSRQDQPFTHYVGLSDDFHRIVVPIDKAIKTKLDALKALQLMLMEQQSAVNMALKHAGLLIAEETERMAETVSAEPPVYGPVTTRVEDAGVSISWNTAK